jgi:hypothetical protein
VAEKRVFDWEAIQIEYAKGTRSNVDIAAQFGVSEGAIRKKARENNWAKDLSAQIRLKAEQKVRQTEYEMSTSYKESRTNAVEVAAQQQADIILNHRTDIRKQRGLRDKLLDICITQADSGDDLERLADILDSGDTDKMQAAFRKAISTPQQIENLKKLSEITKTLVGLEREAFGISDNSNGDADKKQPITNVSYTIIDPQRVDIQQAVVTNNAVIDGNTRT